MNAELRATVVRRERDRIRRYFGHGDRAWQRWPRARQHVLSERRHLLRRVAVEIVRATPSTLRVCDVGCGDGADLAFWTSAGVDPERLAGTEITPELARAARARVPGADVRLVEGFELPFVDGAFDLVTVALVLSSILDDGVRRRLFDEMLRVTAPGGALAVYDMRFRKPTNQRVVPLTPTRLRSLGMGPQLTWPACPLLPVLDQLLRLPAPLARVGTAVLPRTHAIHVWKR